MKNSTDSGPDLGFEFNDSRKIAGKQLECLKINLELMKTKCNSYLIFTTSKPDAVNDLQKNITFPRNPGMLLTHSSEELAEEILGRH